MGEPKGAQSVCLLLTDFALPWKDQSRKGIMCGCCLKGYFQASGRGAPSSENAEIPEK